MAQFNIDSHLSDGKSLQWLALPDAGEQPLDVEVKVRQAAMKKFGQSVFFNCWEHVVASNGYITVRMHELCTDSSSRCGAAESSRASIT